VQLIDKDIPEIDAVRGDATGHRSVLGDWIVTGLEDDLENNESSPVGGLIVFNSGRSMLTAKRMLLCPEQSTKKI